MLWKPASCLADGSPWWLVIQAQAESWWHLHSHRWHVASPASCKWVFRSPCSTPASAPALVRGDARHNTFTCLRDRRLNSHSSAPSRLPYSICRKKLAVSCSQTKFSLGYVYYTVWSYPPAQLSQDWLSPSTMEFSKLILEAETLI